MSDELVWKRRSKGEDNWRARNASDDGMYIVYFLTAYGNNLIEGVLHRDEQRGIDSQKIYTSTLGVGSVAEAKDAAQEHHYAACRARRWADYMRDNEPPTEATA
jgi:hypothetical protein